MRQWYLVLEGFRATLLRPPLGPRNAKMSPMKSFRCVLYPEISCTLVARPQLGKSKFGSVWVPPPPPACSDGCCNWNQIAPPAAGAIWETLAFPQAAQKLTFPLFSSVQEDTATYVRKKQLASTSHKQCKQLQIRHSSKCNGYTPVSIIWKLWQVISWCIIPRNAWQTFFWLINNGTLLWTFCSGGKGGFGLWNC